MHELCKTKAQRKTNHWRIQARGSPLFLDQTEARRAKKKFLETRPHPLSQGLDDRDPLLISKSGSGTANTVKIKITLYNTQPWLVSSIAPSSLESLPCRIALIWSSLQQQDPQLMNQTQIVRQMTNGEHV